MDMYNPMAWFTGPSSTSKTRVGVLETLDDIRDLREFTSCRHQPIPARLPISDDGFELQYAFLASDSSKYEVIELVVEE